MVARRELGSVSHTFSHIAMTLDVEMMSVEVLFLVYYGSSKDQSEDQAALATPSAMTLDAFSGWTTGRDAEDRPRCH